MVALVWRFWSKLGATQKYPNSKTKVLNAFELEFLFVQEREQMIHLYVCELNFCFYLKYLGEIVKKSEFPT